MRRSEIRIDPLTGLRAIVATGEPPAPPNLAACGQVGLRPAVQSAPPLLAAMQLRELR